MRHIIAITAIAIASLPALALDEVKFNEPCNAVMKRAVDLGNSGQHSYRGAIADHETKTVMVSVGGVMWGQRQIVISFTDRPDGSCEAHAKTGFSGLTHRDAHDFLKRIEQPVNEAQK